MFDVASQPGEYLPVEMNCDLNSFAASHDGLYRLVPRPCAEHPECSEKKCYMLKHFLVSHSWYHFLDGSNVCYRIICRKAMMEQLRLKQLLREQATGGHMAAAGLDQDKAYIIHDCNKRSRSGCQWFRTGVEVDASDINS